MSKVYTCFSVGPQGLNLRRDQYRVCAHGIEYVKQSVVAFNGPCQVIGVADTFFGGPESKSYVSKVMVNPTWGQLYRCLASQIKRTNDKHHCFLEGARVLDEHEGIKLIELSLGS